MKYIGKAISASTAPRIASGSSMVRVLCLITAMSLLGMVPIARGDATLAYHERLDAQVETPRSYRVIVSNGRVGIFESEDASLPGVVFDGAASTLAFVDHRNRQYTVLSEEWMAMATKKTMEVSKKMEARMAETMKDMPPEMQARYQQGQMGMQMMPMMAPFLGGMTGGASQPKNYQPSLVNRNVNGFTCRQVDVRQGSKMVQQLCVAERNALSIPAQDLETLQAMRRLTDKLTGLGAFTFGFTAPVVAEGGGQNGLPVAVRNLDDSNGSLLTLESVTSEAIEPDTLEIPGNYLEAKIPLPDM